jgi:hypothetical protein
MGRARSMPFQELAGTVHDFMWNRRDASTRLFAWLLQLQSRGLDDYVASFRLAIGFVCARVPSFLARADQKVE